MVSLAIRFPLGVYCALSTDHFDRPEWPPSPVRLIGALLAAAHESDAVDPEAGRTVLAALCAAGPPTIIAPVAAPCGSEQIDGSRVVAEVRGVSRWAPRNHAPSELKKVGVSPRNIGRDRTEVHKGGVVVGESPVEIRWSSLELEPRQLNTLEALAEEVSFLGTSRSPATVRVRADAATDRIEAGARETTWEPASELAGAAAEVRVPIPSTIAAFDARHAQRASTGKQRVAKAGHIPATAVGASVPYATVSDRKARELGLSLDPRHWGSVLILELEAASSDLRPRVAATYLIARAFRAALLGAGFFAPEGSPGEAPSILRGHGGEPHVAIVPLSFVGHEHADGLIRGIAVVLPHEDRVSDVARQQLALETALRKLITEQHEVRVPAAGALRFRVPPPGRRLPETLKEDRYRGPARTWASITPVIHARRRTSSGPRGIERQIAADCAHVGLPEPVGVEVLRAPALAGSPGKLLDGRAVPAGWRASQHGPRSHLRLTFEQPIEGPVLLGRARHFGVGLCIPVEESTLPAPSPPGAAGAP